MVKKFYLLGCQRSGTTLLRLILESHKRIACLDESRSYEILGDILKMEELVKQYWDKKYIGFKIPRFTEQLNREYIFDYGLEKPIKNFYKDDPLIFITRDVRDVVCSMKSLDGNKDSWLKEWGIPIIEFWFRKLDVFRKEYGSEITMIEDFKNYDFGMGALYWKFKNASYFQYKKKGFPIIKIKYEDLVTQSENTLNGIARFLGLDWDDALLQHHLISHSEIDEKGFAIGNTDSRMPISTFHLHRYKNELSESEINEIMKIAGSTMEMLGYNN